MPTLLRALIEASGLSRRKAFAAIREGAVRVRGVVVTEPSTPYEGASLTLDGEDLVANETAKTYLVLNKPPGYISTRSDEQGRRTVLDLVPRGLWTSGLHPIGRLDRDTTGLLLLTDDGSLTYVLTHPKHEIEKEYWLSLEEPPDEEQMERLRAGVELDGGVRRPLRLRRLLDAEPFQISLTIQEGHRRQVRRMLDAVGAKVTRLRRVREGSLLLGDLPEGAVRRLSASEVAALRQDSLPTP